MIKKFLDYFINESDDIPDFDEEVKKEQDDKLVEVPFDDGIEYDGITLSLKLENRLKELKINTKPKIEVGDKIMSINKNKGKLPDRIFSFLESRNIFEVLRINTKGKIDIGCYQRYIREGDGKKIKKVFYFSPRRFQKIENLDPVAQFFLSLKHIDKTNLMQTPVDYLDVDNKGNLTGLSRRNYNEGEDPFKSNRRQGLKLNKLLLRVATKDYYNQMLKPTDIELFLNKWRMLFDDTYTVQVLEGLDILDAYDHDTISNGWKGSSCANFANRNNIGTRYNVYTDNVENVKCLVVYHKGKIHGRRMMFTGEQIQTHGKYIEGRTYIFLNSYYGEGGSGAKAYAAMDRWIKDNKANDVNAGRNNKDIFRIKINKTCYEQYPPWDYMYVNFKTDEIASNHPDGGGYGGGKNRDKNWIACYGARCKK